MRGKGEVSWRGENKRTPWFTAAVVAVMAVMGFGVSGALIAGTAVRLADVGAFSAADHPTTPHVPLQIEKLQMSMDLAKASMKASVHKTTSSNWAGYVAESSTTFEVTQAYALFFVPTITCGAIEPTLSDQWVGIDGYGSSTVEQTGVVEYCTSDGGATTYLSWYEYYPEDPVYENTVYAGDEIQAYVSFSGATDVFSIFLQDLTQGVGLATWGNPESGEALSAECISENIVGEGTYYLADYGTEWFYSCQATVNGYVGGIGGLPSGAHVTVFEITNVGPDSGLVDQKVSKLYNYEYKDDEFSVTYKNPD